MRPNGPKMAVGLAALFFQIRESQKPLRAFVTNFRSSLDFRRHFRVKDPEPRHWEERGGGSAVPPFQPGSEWTRRQVKSFSSRSGCHTSSPLPRGRRQPRGLEPERRRRLGELRCLSPLPLGGRAAAEAPLPRGGSEPVSARASPLPQADPSCIPRGLQPHSEPLLGTWRGLPCRPSGLRPGPGRDRPTTAPGK